MLTAWKSGYVMEKGTIVVECSRESWFFSLSLSLFGFALSLNSLGQPNKSCVKWKWTHTQAPFLSSRPQDVAEYYVEIGWAYVLV